MSLLFFHADRKLRYLPLEMPFKYSDYVPLCHYLELLFSDTVVYFVNSWEIAKILKIDRPVILLFDASTTFFA